MCPGLDISEQTYPSGVNQGRLKVADVKRLKDLGKTRRLRGCWPARSRQYSGLRVEAVLGWAGHRKHVISRGAV